MKTGKNVQITALGIVRGCFYIVRDNLKKRAYAFAERCCRVDNGERYWRDLRSQMGGSGRAYDASAN